MSKIENICKAVASLPHVKADANVFMIDDFSGQIQGSWADKRIVYTSIFKELKDSKVLPEKSNLVTDFWQFTEEWIKEIHKKDPKQFPASGKELSFGEKKEIFKAYLKSHPEYTNGKRGKFGHITLLPAYFNSYGSMVMVLKGYNLLNTRDYSDDSLFIALDEGGYAYDYQGNILIKSMKDLREELEEQQEFEEYWGSYYTGEKAEYRHDLRKLVRMKYDWELSEEELELYAQMHDMDHDFAFKTRKESNCWDDLGDGYRSFVNDEGETVAAGRSRASKKLHYAVLPLEADEYRFQREALEAQLKFEAEHPGEDLWTQGEDKHCGVCGQRYYRTEVCCPRCFAVNNDRKGLSENVGLSSVWEYVCSPEEYNDPESNLYKDSSSADSYRFGDTELE
jgi:hypothetical protein